MSAVAARMSKSLVYRDAQVVAVRTVSVKAAASVDAVSPPVGSYVVAAVARTRC